MFNSLFRKKPKNTIEILDSLHDAIKSNNMQKVKNTAANLSPKDIAELASSIGFSWYSQRQYNSILPVISNYIQKTDGRSEPTLDILRDGKCENQLNGWLGTASVICVVQTLGTEFIPEILLIINGSYCEPSNGFIGRDGLAEMMIMLLPFMPPPLHKNWLSKTIDSINNTFSLDDKAIAIAKLCDFIDTEDEKTRIVKEAMLALKENFGNFPNENAHAIALLKKKAPSSLMDAICKLESELRSDK